MRLERFAWLLLLGCSTKGAAPADGGDDPYAPYTKAWDRPVARPTDDEARAKRAACAYKAGDLPAETLGAGVPVGDAIPIDTVVVLMQENRSFDHYFSQLPAYLGRNDIAVAPPNVSLPDKAGGGAGMHVRQHAPHMCNDDTNHEWPGSHLEYDDGKNDGFFEANDQQPPGGKPPELYTGDRSLWYFDQTDIPFYYDLAKAFGIADHYYCALLGPTWPNRMYLYSATSFGITFSAVPNVYDMYPFPDRDISVADMLEKRRVPWSVFAEGTPVLALVHGGGLANRWGDHRPVQPLSAFFDAAASGTLPAFSFVDPSFNNEGSLGDDEHPPGDPQVGQRFVYRIVTALTKSPQWKRSVLFVTYDEHGGYYDSVPPPPACAPDDYPLRLDVGDSTMAKFDRYGFRVPLFVVSPYTKQGYVAHGTYDHTSITRFVEAKFKLPALTARDANADVPMEFFDFQSPPYVTPPTFAEPAVDQAKLDYCTTSFPPRDGGF